jgi:hypothetical protein
MVVIFLLVFLAAVTVTAAERLVHLLPYIVIALAAYLAGKQRQRLIIRRAIHKMVMNSQYGQDDTQSTVYRCDVVSAYPPEVKPQDWSSEDSGQWPGDSGYTESNPENLTARNTIINDPMSGVRDLYGRN